MKLDSALIEGFVGSVLSKNFDHPVRTPPVHREWWDLCCSDAKYVAIAAPRGHAKSTAITHAYTLASVLFRDKNFVVIISDTEAQAIMFLGNIKRELLENEDISNLFGINKIIKDSETDIIVQMKDGHKFRIMAKGAEQKLRGMLWDGKRPDLIICDDMENEEMVYNQERRVKYKKWFKGAVMPALSRTGCIRLVGTVLHLDSLLENLLPQDWSKFTVHEELKSYSTNKKQLWKSIRYRAHNTDYTNFLWPEIFTKKNLMALRQHYVDDGIGDVYNQEYLNNPIDESRAYFRRGDLLPMSDGMLDDILLKHIELNYYVTVDLAISEKARADWSVFVVGGVDSENMLYIVEIIRTRMDSRDIINTIFELHEKYHPQLFVFEKGQIEKAIGPFLREESFRQGVFPITEGIQPSVDKPERARSIQGRTRVNGVRFNKKTDWYPIFESELLQFPKSKHDDQVDAFAYLGLALDKFAVARTAEEIDYDEYLEEVRQYEDMTQQGRNKTTGW